MSSNKPKPGLLEHANGTAVARFWARVDRSDRAECWNWIGRVGDDGYGRLYLGEGGRRNCLAHRFSWEIAHGPIPAEQQIDHVCRNRRCVNPHPAHLEPVTQRENIFRSEALSAATSRTDVCQRGHRFSENAYTHPKTGKRQCTACRRVRRLAGAA